MNIFQFLIFLGIINIVFGFAWKWIISLLGAVIFSFVKFDKGMLVIKTLGAYFLVSLTALATLSAVQNLESGWQLLVFPLIGVFVIYMGFASNAYEQQKQAQASMDYQLMRQLSQNSTFEMILTISSIVLYILILFIPAISSNFLNEWLFNVIMWAFNLPIIGWVIGIGGVFFMLSIMWYGLLMSVMLIGGAFIKLKGSSKGKA